jgi:tRNA(Arg) A34 adenosine deaminase TadA
MNPQHEPYIRQTIELAWQARTQGDHPFGSLLLLDGAVVLTAVNSVITQRNITHHAELNLISAASQQLSAAQLARSILYASTEPCAMCAGAIYWAGIRTIVYGCAAETLAAMATADFVLPCRSVLAYGAAPTTVIGPILPTEAAQVHEGFWR